MKKIIAWVLLSLIFNPVVNACDICGCGVGNFNPHMFPHLSRNFISLNYNYQYFLTHSHDGAGEEHTEYYRTLQFVSQFSLSKKIQLITALPFQMNRQKEAQDFKSLNQLGDAVVLANYRILDMSTGKQKNVRHTLLAGIGVKLPTGNFTFDENNENEVHNANFQAGTGSTDVLFNSFYNIRIRNWTVTTSGTYKINSKNEQSYKFGNRLLATTQLKFIKEIGKYSLIPNMGFSYEKMNVDRKEGMLVEHTGGENLQLLSGLDINNRKWALGFIYQKPLAQNLADHHIHAMDGFNVHLSYSF